MSDERAKPHVMSYEGWKRRNSEIVQLDDETTECAECDGTGYTTCSHCGSEVECEDCGGTGNVKHKGVSYQYYEAQVAQDRRAWERFFGVPYSMSDAEYSRATAILRPDKYTPPSRLILTIKANH